jgi:sodium transport system permease protein
MSWRNVGIVYRKELRDSLRDRRTLISMIVVPVLAIPLLMLGAGALTARLVSRAREEIAPVMVLGGEDSPKVMAALRELKTIKIVPPSADFTNRINDKSLRAAVVIPRGFEAALARGDTATVQIFEHAGEMKSGFASGVLDQGLRNLRDATVRERLRAHNVPEAVLKPFDLVHHNVAPPARVSGSLLGGVIPYIILILCMTGAMYPAMDLTAGEKERGTLETLLCSPVSRTHVVLGKFLLVLTTSLGTVLLSLVSLVVTSRAAKPLLAGAGSAAAMRLSLTIDPLAVAGVFLMLLPAAVMLSAGLLAVSVFARTMKEAGSYASPLMIAVVLPAMVGVLPGIEPSPGLALVPLVNISLACKEVITGVWHWNFILLALGSSCAYAAAALGVAVWLFQREDVLFRT